MKLKDSPTAGGRVEPSAGPGPVSGGRKLIPAVLAAGFVLAAGVSGFAGGAYDIEVWAPAGIVLLGALIAAVFAVPSRPRSLALLALIGLASLCAWSFLSTFWAESVDRALIDSYRLLVYTAAFGFLWLTMAASRESLRVLPLAGAAAGVLAVAVSVVVRLASGDAGSLFVASRLNGPLGYFNAEGAFFILGFWPLVAVAVGARSRVAGAAAAGASAMLVDLVVLTQSRGALAALVLSAAVLGTIHRQRIPLAWTLLAVGAGVAVAVPALADVTGVADAPSGGPERSAALAIVLGAILTAACYLAGRELARRLSDRRPLIIARQTLPAAALVAAALLVTILVAPHIGDEARAFKDLRQPDPQARLFTAGGYRYDYWRVAAVTFAHEPLRGVGAGNYDFDYFRQRRTSEDIRQPHSLPLQTLAELGVLGGIALGLFVFAVLAAIWRLTRSRTDGAETPTWVLAAAGIFVAWTVHSAVDWTHLMPADTALALGAAATLLAPWHRGADLVARRPLVAVPVLLICAASLAGAAGLGRFARADGLADEAQLLIAKDPAEAASRASKSLDLNGTSLRARYIKAAALARRGDSGRATVVLRDAARREPHRYLTWALLGDLAVRRGRLAQAQRQYARASRLNPRDRSLRELSTDRDLLRRLNRNPDNPAIP